jgi:hypothetical protein
MALEATASHCHTIVPQDCISLTRFPAWTIYVIPCSSASTQTYRKTRSILAPIFSCLPGCPGEYFYYADGLFDQKLSAQPPRFR